MSFIWSRTDGASGPSISIIFDSGLMATVGKEHASLAEITQKLAVDAPDAEIIALLNPVKTITKRLQRLSTRVTTDGENLFFDGDAVNDSIADYILKLIRLESENVEAPSWKPLVNFLEKLAQNPQKESTSSLYTFIQHYGLTILPNGDFVAYKGILSDYGSVHAGPGIVDNVNFNGHLPNKPGSILELKRSDISTDTNVGCAVGLHAGTAKYAAGWGPLVVAVAINPRDVVSVPDCSAYQKIRVCRYEVLTEIARPTKVAGTVGETSAPVYTEAVVAGVNDDFVKKLEKAVKKGHTLEVEYLSRNNRPGTKVYIIKPTKLEGTNLQLTLPKDNDAIRTFRLERIKSIKRLDK